MKLFLSFCIWVVCIPQAYAQIGVDTLKNVDVHATPNGKDDLKRAYGPGMQRLMLDSAVLTRNVHQQLGSLLPEQLPVYVKSYGFNSLATLQLRGASAAQTMVLWEGVPLANAALGVADLSTIPVFGLSEAEIVYGSSSALLGSGNVGGALVISTSGLRRNAGASAALFLGTGSFSQYVAGARGAWTKGRLRMAASCSGQQARNDFTYTTTNGEERRMPNNRGLFGNAAGTIAFEVSKKDNITAQVWFSESFRALPPALFEQQSHASLRGRSLRTLLHWQHEGTVSWFAKAAGMREDLRYENPVLSAVNENRSALLFGESGISYRGRKGTQLLLSGSGQHSSLLNDPLLSQQRLSLTLSGVQAMIQQRLRLAFSFRGERVGENTFSLPGVNASYRVFPFTVLRLNLQKTYRVPTLNELYYSPGGNPDLRPEQGWHSDAGWTISRSAEQWTIRHDASGYLREIRDWVAWFGGAIWTPHNISRVRSAGFETENVLTYRQDSNTLWQLKVHAAYCNSITTASYVPNDGSIGAQVPYAPRILTGAVLSCQYRKFYLAYNQAYTSLRYITTDESASVPAYTTGRVSAEYSLPARNTLLILRAALNNVWNFRYETISGRPAPGRYGEISVEWRRN